MREKKREREREENDQTGKNVSEGKDEQNFFALVLDT